MTNKPPYSKGVISNIGIIESLMNRMEGLANAIVNEIIDKSIEPTIWKAADPNDSFTTPAIVSKNGTLAWLVQVYKGEQGQTIFRFVDKENFEYNMQHSQLNKYSRIEVPLFLGNKILKPLV